MGEAVNAGAKTVQERYKYAPTIEFCRLVPEEDLESNIFSKRYKQIAGPRGQLKS